MPVIYNEFKSKHGFQSPGFTVSENGDIEFGGNLTSNGHYVVQDGGLVVSEINDLTITGTVEINASAPGNMNNVAVGATIARAGTFTALSATTSVTFTPSGTVSISPTGTLTINPVAVGSIDNVNIGASTRGTGSFTTLNVNTGLTLAPTSTGAINNVNIGATTPGTGKFTSSTITTAPTAVDHATRKDYVDTKIAAFSIALGS